jgi:hypothetical protein
VGSPSAQTLRRAVRRPAGMATEDLVGCVFVKLVGVGGWPDDRIE